jgi:peptidoglycan/LPS O-acetylase OafA/YrhL
MQFYYIFNFFWTVNNLFPLDPDYSVRGIKIYFVLKGDNVLKILHQCMGQTWYLAVDMQLFVVSPLLIYPLWRWKKWGLAWLALIALACQGVIFFVYARDDLTPTLWVTRMYILSHNFWYSSMTEIYSLLCFLLKWWLGHIRRLFWSLLRKTVDQSASIPCGHLGRMVFAHNQTVPESTTQGK